MTCGARAPSNQLAGWGAARHHRGAGHESRINPKHLRQVRGSIFLLLLVWFAGDMKSERPSKDDEQHCRCVVWEEKTVLQSLDVAFSAPGRKSPFLRGLHFLRRRTSTGFASRRFSRWQSENQKDSRLGRVRIIISDGTCALLNAQQIKMVSREACVCAMCSKTGQGFHVCMRAYLRNLLGSAARCRPNPCCGTSFVQFFCSLFVNRLCRKPEIESLGFTCN